jgi:membrane-bound lytic murein transglycosylase D
MKKLFISVFCLLSLQLVKAATGLQPAGAAPKHSRDTTFAHTANTLPLTGYEGQIKRRLDSIKKDIPLDYNVFVQNYINLYLQDRDEMAHVIGLSKYYFPIYEKAFHNAGIPDEIKYLSIVESKLDPYAVSRVGATGPWQFMTTTAKLYGLNMDSYVDERRDPVRASYAAAAYLKDAYEEFGDWLLAIASYNCGKSNIENAMAKSGANDFWSIRQYLPAETRNYVPAYIAVAYIMNYYSKHNIVPEACQFSMKMDTLLVDKYVSLSNISGILNIDLKLLSILNPVYRTYIINGSAANPCRLIIPQTSSDKYAALYDALNNPSPVPSLGFLRRHRHPEYIAANDDGQSAKHKTKRRGILASIHNYITYRVKRGDTLGAIALKFDGASVEKIRSLNGLTSAQLQPGMKLKISKG